jgi:hypothetical protein
MRLHAHGYDLSVICHKNAEFEPHAENVTNSLFDYKDRLPIYVRSAIEKRSEELIQKSGMPDERIPPGIEYEW